MRPDKEIDWRSKEKRAPTERRTKEGEILKPNKTEREKREGME